MTAIKVVHHAWVRVFVCLLLLLPAVLLFLLLGGSYHAEGHWFWVLLLLCFWIMFSLGQPDAAAVHMKVPPAKRMLNPEEQPAVVREVMNVEVATAETGWLVFRGKLRDSTDLAYGKLKSALSGVGVALLQEDDDGGPAIYLPQPGSSQAIPESPTRPWLHWLLFVLTILTTTAAGVAFLPYALGLMAILGIHELGHYFVAKRHGIRLTPPFFFPVPFALGTFGAFIQMRSTPENRKALFDVAVAGPLAGLAIAIPALVILFALLAKATLGQSLTYGHVLQLSPLAFAGWSGLFITALNLIPVGQLDGGHIVQSLFGRRIGGTIGGISMWSLLLLALFVWPGLMMWAILVFFIAGGAAPPMNDLTPLTVGRKWLGYAALIILLLILMPLPHSLWGTIGIHCPYA